MELFAYDSSVPARLRLNLFYGLSGIKLEPKTHHYIGPIQQFNMDPLGWVKTYPLALALDPSVYSRRSEVGHQMKSLHDIRETFSVRSTSKA